MKLSAHHKFVGDDVEWYEPTSSYDVVYGSKVFDFTMPMVAVSNSERVIVGGCAIDLENKLPPNVEHVMPDYSIYGTETAYGYLTRGCPRNCSFCNVSQHQGFVSERVADLSEFWTGQKEIVLLDPNMYASKDWKVCSDQLIKAGSAIDFSQGVDIRVMTPDKVDALNQLNIKIIHFAWDNYEFTTYEKLKRLRREFKFSGRNMRVYVLTNFNTTHEQDLDRVMKLRDLDYDPYVMIFNKELAPKVTKRLARWVNSKFIWRSVDNFADYGKKIEVVLDGQQTLF